MNILKTLTEKSIKDNLILKIQIVTFMNAKMTPIFFIRIYYIFCFKKEFTIISTLIMH